MRASLLLLALLSAAPFGRCKAADDGSAITKAAAEPPSAGAQSSSAEALRTLVQAVADADRGEGPLAVAEKLVPQEDPNYKAWSQHLLPYLTAQSVEPWIVARPIAIYIIYAELFSDFFRLRSHSRFFCRLLRFFFGKCTSFQ